jgi:MFS family permease
MSPAVKLRDSLGALGVPAFRLLWTGQSLSLLGDALVPVALALAVVQATGSAAALGVVLAAALVPRLALLLVGGVFADRFPPQRVMLVADVARAVVQGLVAVELGRDHPSVVLLAVLSAVAGAASGLFTPGMTGLVARTVPEEHRRGANALLGLARSATGLVGPALAGLLVATVGGRWAFAFDAATYAVSAVSLAMLRVDRLVVERTGMLGELREGLSEVRRRRWYARSLVGHAVWNFAMGATFVLGPLVAVRQLGGAGAWATVATGEAVGALLGGALALRLHPRRPLVVGSLALSLSAGLPATLAVPAPVAVITVAAALSAVGLCLLNTLWETTVQNHVPEHVISRVVAWDWLASLVAMPVGFAAAGPVAAAVGTAPTLAVAAVATGCSGLACLLVGEVRRLGLRPEAAAQPPAEGRRSPAEEPAALTAL